MCNDSWNTRISRCDLYIFSYTLYSSVNDTILELHAANAAPTSEVRMVAILMLLILRI